MYHTCLRTSGLVLILGLGIGIGSQLPLRELVNAKDAEPANAKKLAPLKLGMVNIARVLNEFKKANADGIAVKQRRQSYIDEAKPLREEVVQLTNQLKTATAEEEKKRLREKTVQINREIEDIEREGQKEVARMSDRIILEAYQEIREMIVEVGKEHGADIVTAYPDTSDEKKDLTPAIAQAKLQTPGMTPFYLNPELDLTREVVARLNKKYPVEKKKIED